MVWVHMIHSVIALLGSCCNSTLSLIKLLCLKIFFDNIPSLLCLAAAYSLRLFFPEHSSGDAVYLSMNTSSVCYHSHIAPWYQLLPDSHPTFESHLLLTYTNHTRRLKIHQEERTVVNGSSKNLIASTFLTEFIKPQKLRETDTGKNSRVFQGQPGASCKRCHTTTLGMQFLCKLGK